MNVTDILEQTCVCVPLKGTEKTAVITELVDILAANGCLEERDAVLEAVLNREGTRSTGVGEGLAVPHGKSRGCRRLVMSVGKPATPMDFESIDGRPCEFIVLLASPLDTTGPHIQALGRVSRLWRQGGFRTEVAKATTAEELFASIQQFQA